MKEKKTYNQAVDGDADIKHGATDAACENEACDTMADEAAAATDSVADEASNEEKTAPAVEETDWRDKYLRLQAEFDNFRKRTLREKMALIESGGSDVWKAVLPVLDDMERAIAASEKSDDIAALREGEKLIYNKFVDIMRQKGVVEIEALDTDFNPDLHEAVARFAAGEEKSGKVIDVVQRGYKQGEQVLRYTKVVVGE